MATEFTDKMREAGFHPDGVEQLTFMVGATRWRRGPAVAVITANDIGEYRGTVSYYYGVPGCTFALLEVDKAERRKGYGEAAFRDVVRILSETNGFGTGRIKLEVIGSDQNHTFKPGPTTDRLRKLYERYGFESQPGTRIMTLTLNASTKEQAA